MDDNLRWRGVRLKLMGENLMELRVWFKFMGENLMKLGLIHRTLRLLALEILST